MSAARAMFQIHPAKPTHADIMGRCVDACFECVEACTTCADACLSERDLEHLVACIRLNQDCVAICMATGNILSRANKHGNRQPTEALLTTCIAFCRACADECARHAPMHKHCGVCAKACRTCADACTDMLAAMRMPT